MATAPKARHRSAAGVLLGRLQPGDVGRLGFQLAQLVPLELFGESLDHRPLAHFACAIDGQRQALDDDIHLLRSFLASTFRRFWQLT